MLEGLIRGTLLMAKRWKRVEPQLPDPWETSARIVESFADGASSLLTELLANIAEAIREQGISELSARLRDPPCPNSPRRSKSQKR